VGKGGERETEKGGRRKGDYIPLFWTKLRSCPSQYNITNKIG